MICWDRNDEVVVGAFQPAHVGWLHGQLAGFRDLVDARLREYASPDPIAARLGLPLPTAPLTDSRLHAVLRTYVPDTEPAPVRQWQEPDVLGNLRAGIETVLATLPDHGGIVQLRHADQVRNWIAVLLDLRTAYAVTAGLPWELDCPLPDTLPHADPRRPACVLSWWLRDVVERLTETVGLTPVV